MGPRMAPFAVFVIIAFCCIICNKWQVSEAAELSAAFAMAIIEFGPHGAAIANPAQRR